MTAQRDCKNAQRTEFDTRVFFVFLVVVVVDWFGSLIFCLVVCFRLFDRASHGQHSSGELFFTLQLDLLIHRSPKIELACSSHWMAFIAACHTCPRDTMRSRINSRFNVWAFTC